MKMIPESVKTAFFIVLFVFLFLYIFAKLFGPIPFSVNSITTTKTDLFTVSGEGEATAVPDTAQINLGVTKSAATVESAKDQVNTAANDIIAGLKALGVEEKDVKTTNYSVNPNYDYATGSVEKINGYTVSQNLSVEVKEIDRANKVVDMAAEKGANQVGGIQFILADDKREELEKIARKDAIEKAKAKANDIASAAGIRLGKLINVSESGTGVQPPIFYDTMALKAGNEARQDTELQPGENMIRVSVTLMYETL